MYSWIECLTLLHFLQLGHLFREIPLQRAARLLGPDHPGQASQATVAFTSLPNVSARMISAFQMIKT